MDRLWRFKESVYGYMSPLSKRTHPSTPKDNATSMHRPLLSQPNSEPRGRKSRATISGRINKKYLSPSDTKRFRTKKTAQAESEYEADEEELVEEDDEENISDDDEDDAEDSEYELEPDDSTSQRQAPETEKDYNTTTSVADEYAESEEEEDVENNFDDEEELSAEEKVNLFLDRQGELARRQKTVDDIKGGDWHQDEINLFKKLTMRGFEPLLPSHWRLDFRTIPTQLFSAREKDTFINSQSGKEFRASIALISLITLGSRVRALLECGKPQEKCIKKELLNYIKWSEQDGGYFKKRFLPILCVVAGRPDQELTKISRSITDQLEFLAKRHRESLAVTETGQFDEDGEPVLYTKQPPVLYGVIISRCIVVFITLDSARPEAKLRTIAHFDFSDKNMDVWNGLAVAILICSVRNYLVSVRDEMEDETDGESSDPDL